MVAAPDIRGGMIVRIEGDTGTYRERVKGLAKT
jgi:hypothetical protein